VTSPPAASCARAHDRIEIDAARRRLAQQFRQAGIDTPELDARLLVGHALGLDHAALVAQSRRVLAREETDAIAALAARRLAHEPVARILGQKEFWGLPLRLNADTLLPRPETETVVEASLAALAAEDRRSQALRIADLGTGSGALLLALLAELPNASGIGTDISPAALECASGNADALGLAGRASFIACDYGTALNGPVDLLVSNPPYVARGDIAGLQPEVRDFDPRRALDGGPDGLDGYRAIAADAQRLLAPGGTLAVELGCGQLAAATALFTATGLAPGAAKHDLSGMPRALILQALPKFLP
jgi:release factor glutamine methyltransferase